MQLQCQLGGTARQGALARASSTFGSAGFLKRVRRVCTVQGRRAVKKLAQGDVPPLLLKMEGVIGPETAFAFLKM